MTSIEARYHVDTNRKGEQLGNVTLVFPKTARSGWRAYKHKKALLNELHRLFKHFHYRRSR